MGRSKAKIRFVVRVGGKDRELFAVRDRSPDGSVQILLKETPFFQNDELGPRYWRAAERRISIHPSDGSLKNGTTIKHHKIAADGLFEDAAFVNESRERLCWPIRSVRQWAFEGDNIASPRDKDTVLRLQPYDERLTTLFFQIWAWDNKRDIPPPASPVQMVTAMCRRFQLAVYYVFVPAQPLIEGYSISVSTSSTRVNEGDTEQTHPEAVSVEEHEVDEMIKNFFGLLATEFTKRGEDVFGRGPLARMIAVGCTRIGTSISVEYSV